MAHTTPGPILATPTPAIHASRPSDEHGDRQQILHDTNSTANQSHMIPTQTFTGSSALGGTDLDDDLDVDSTAGHSLAPPHITANRRSPSPRTISSSVGTIGGHRSPAPGNASAHTSNSHSPPSAQLFDSQDSFNFHSIRSTSPSAPPTRAANNDSPAPPFHAFRSVSPSFASALSHQSSSGRMSPMGINDRNTPSLYQVMGQSQQQQQQQQEQSPQRFNTASPASTDRPSSRLDIGKLQQRQHNAAAAAAANQRQAQARQDSGNAPGTLAQQLAPHRGTPTLVFPDQTPHQRPELVQPRPEMPMRTYSESSSGAGMLSPVPDLISPGLHPSNLVPQLAGMTVKPDGYPFPAPQQQTFAGGPVDRSGHNSSRQSFRSAAGHCSSRIGSPMRFSNSPSFGASEHQARQQGQQMTYQQQQQQQPNQHHQQQTSPSHITSEQRLANVEAALEELNKGLTSVARSVGWLIEREKEREATHSTASNGSGSKTASASDGASAMASRGFSPAHGEELKMLGQQVSVLSSSVHQLMIAQQQQQQQQQRQPDRVQHQPPPFAPPHGAVSPSFAPAPPNTAHLGNDNGQMGVFHPQAGPISPNFGPAGPFQPPPPPMEARGVSPRPGPNARQAWSGSPNPETNDGSRRWSHLPPGAGDLGAIADANHRRDSLVAPGAVGSGMAGPMPPPEAHMTVTKWEHLNLQPDLLRSVLKYGLGPPNKIQQRALPFLLRGSDIIAQAPPTQERIASYVIPALQCVLNSLRTGGAPPPQECGPLVLMISTTVDQATQAQRMALGLGSSLGVRVHIAAAASVDAVTEAQNILQSRPHIVVGTPAKMSEVITNLVNLQGAAMNLGDIKMVVLDEVDQMIARNLSDHVGSLLRVLPPVSQSVRGQSNPAVSPGLPPTSSGFNSFEGAARGGERQTAIFSNTVPQDVLNFAQSIHLRESVRVLVRREGTSVTQHPPPGAEGRGGVVNGGGPGAGPNGTGSNVPRSGFAQQQQHQQHQQQQHAGIPSNALGAVPTHNLARQSATLGADPSLQLLKGLRQYYLYIAVSDARPMPTSSGFSSTGGEMKLDVIADLLEDMEFNQAVIYTGSSGALEAVTYKLASRGIEALALHRDMALHTRQQVIGKFRSPLSTFGTNRGGTTRGNGGAARKALVGYDVALNPREVHQIPLIIFYDLPRSLEEYKEKLACGAAGAGGMSRPSVCINVVTGSGGPRGDIEMLKTLESGLGCKMAELPIDAKGLLNE